MKALLERNLRNNGTAVVAGKRFHFIGAGGIGMSGLAKLLLKNNAIVTGSDQNPSPVTDMLIDSGADIRIGHCQDNLEEQTDAVVISAAVKEDNPELVAARKRENKVYKYAQMLGFLMESYDGIAISGTHGKSTTCGWLVYLLKQMGIDANFIIGAEIMQLGCSSGAGNSRFFIAEACEFDRSFLNLKPKIGCILNIEADHLDYYKDENEIVEAFGDFAGGVKKGGVLIANGTDSKVKGIINSITDRRVETFGLERTCDFYADNLKIVNGFYSFEVFHKGVSLGTSHISVPGKHNVMNALAVTAMAVNCGLDGRQVVENLGGFTGMDRRLMIRGQVDGITVLDDYAHHPTEIKASLEAMRQKYQPKKLWCIFQPHQYSRTRFFLKDFAESFKLADITIVPEIYFVRDSQESKKEVNAQILVESIRQNGGEALFIGDFAGICDYLEANVTKGDLVVTMGAGDIWKVADEYIQRLGKYR